jgi:hypothetical protein
VEKTEELGIDSLQGKIYFAFYKPVTLQAFGLFAPV